MANTFLVPHKIWSGKGALNEAMDSFVTSMKKPLVVTDPTMVQLGNLKKVTDVLEQKGIPYVVEDGIDHEPDDLMILKGTKTYQENDCDAILALGGGSVIDSMKAIGLMSQSSKPIASYMGKPIVCEMPMMVAIPTTAGTGSEATKFTIINDTNTQVKMLLTGECLMPDVAIIDPQFTMTAPWKVTAATGIDALCHCTEAYTSRKAQPMSDTFALSAMKRIFENLLTCCERPDDEEARIQMSIAATEAGIAFSNSSVTIVHGMSRPIGALFHIAHGLSNAILLETCMRFVVDGAYERFAEMSRYCGFSQSTNDQEAANAFIEAEAKLLADLKIPTLAQCNVSKEDYTKAIEKMAIDAIASGSPANTWKKCSQEDLMELYAKTYQ